MVVMMVQHSLVSARIKQRVMIEKKVPQTSSSGWQKAAARGKERRSWASRQKACRQPGAVAGVRGWVVQLGHASHIAAQFSSSVGAYRFRPLCLGRTTIGGGYGG